MNYPDLMNLRINHIASRREKERNRESFYLLQLRIHSSFKFIVFPPLGKFEWVY